MVRAWVVQELVFSMHRHGLIRNQALQLQYWPKPHWCDRQNEMANHIVRWSKRLYQQKWTHPKKFGSGWWQASLLPWWHCYREQSQRIFAQRCNDCPIHRNEGLARARELAGIPGILAEVEANIVGRRMKRTSIWNNASDYRNSHSDPWGIEICSLNVLK